MCVFSAPVHTRSLRSALAERPRLRSRVTAAVQVSVQFHTRCGAGTAAPPSLCTHTRTADLNAVKKLKKSLQRNNRMETQRRACERCCYLHTELYILTLTPPPLPHPQHIHFYTLAFTYSPRTSSQAAPSRLWLCTITVFLLPATPTTTPTRTRTSTSLSCLPGSRPAIDC